MQTLHTISLGQARLLSSQLWKCYNEQAHYYDKTSYADFLIDFQDIFVLHYGFNYCHVIDRFVFAENHAKFKTNPEHYCITDPAKFTRNEYDWLTKFQNS